MAYIKLYFETIYDPELQKKVKDIEIVRLKCLVIFKRIDDIIEYRDAIIDTGAYISLIPESIWKYLTREELTKHKVKGLSIKPECAIPVKIGKINCTICDLNGNATKKQKIYAYLASTDKVPLILGFKDLLSKFKICFDYDKNKAYIET